jgi:glycosyltransferase involved in cell wall biosynthesis
VREVPSARKRPSDLDAEIGSGDPSKARVYILLEHVFGHGGVPRTSLNLAKQLAERGHEVEVVSVVQRRAESFFPVDERVRLTVLDDQRPGRDDLRRFLRPRRKRLQSQPSRLVPVRPDSQKPGRPGGDAKLSRWTDLLLERKLRGLSAGVVIATRPNLAVAVARWAPEGVLRLAQEHISFQGRSPWVRKALQEVAGDLDAVLTLTEEDRELWRRSLAGTSTLVEAIPNASPFDVGGPAPLESRTVIAAGRLSHQKGFDRLIPAFAKVAQKFPDWQLHIYGAGPDERALKRAVRANDLTGTVVLKGLVPGLEEAFRNASIYAMSSRFEGLPMVLLEAMSQGLPIVSFDCPEGPRQLVTDGVNGLLVPDGDVDALADALLRLIADPAERRRMGLAALDRAQGYTADAVVARWEALFERLLGPGGGRDDDR